jgi:hypothetical protein
VIAGVSTSEPKFTVAPGATFSAVAVSTSGKASPVGANNGAKNSNFGAPTTLLTGAVTVNVTEFDICAAFVTVTTIVPGLATVASGTATVNASQFDPPQVEGVTELGANTVPPKFTCVPIPRPMPVMVKVKFPLPAGTLAGEIEAICV